VQIPLGRYSCTIGIHFTPNAKMAQAAHDEKVGFAGLLPVSWTRR